MSPTLIVLEGPDGAGKTRHVRALTTALTRAQIHAEWFEHQPSALNACGAAPDPWTAALHYATERDRLRRRIARGSAADVLVCDRWWLSTQVVGLVLDNDALGRPALTVVLTAPDDVLDARLAARGTPTTDRDREIRRTYESLARVSGLPLIDTSGPPEAVTARLVELVRGVLPRQSQEGA